MTALLILGPFICVWAIAVIFYYMGRRRANQVRLAEISFSQSVQNRFTSTFINRPKTWLTVKSRNSEDVARSIGLIDLQPCESRCDGGYRYQAHWAGADRQADGHGIRLWGH